MAQLSDDCFAFSGPLLPVDEVERIIRERVMPVAEVEAVPLHAADGRVIARDVADQNVGDPLDVIEIDDRNSRRRQWRIRSDGDDRRVTGMKQRLADGGTVYFELGMRLALVAFDQHEIDRAELLEQGAQRRLASSTQLVHQRPTVGRSHQNLGRPRHAMGVGILAGLIDVEAVMSVLEGRDLKAPCDDAGDDFGEERSLAGAAPAGQADDAHAALYSSPKRARGDSESAAAIMKAPGNRAGRCISFLAGGYSAGCIFPFGGGAPTWPSALSCSNHRLWCSFAQLTSTVPSHIPSNAPSIPIVPI